jgi:hypothetical protein
MAIADDRAKAVELALAQIEKQFGKGSIVRLGSKEALVPIAVIPTGSISFDAATGVGGIPRGRVTEIYALSPRAKPQSACRSSPRRRKRAVWLLLSTSSTLWTPVMPRNWAWTSIT